MGLLDDGAWQGKVWTGAWSEGSGGTYDAVEPATGETLGAVGKATPEDVHAPSSPAYETTTSSPPLPSRLASWMPKTAQPASAGAAGIAPASPTP